MSELATQFDPLGKAQMADPYAFYTLARQQEPFYTERVLDRGVYVVTRYKDIMDILSQPEVFSSRDALHPLVEWAPQTFGVLAHGFSPTPIHISSDGANHRRFRAPLERAFSRKRVNTIETLIRDHANTLLDGFMNDRSTDIISRFAYPLPLEVILLLFGLPKGDLESVKMWCDDWLALVSSWLHAEQQVACAESVVEFQRYMARLIEERRAHPRESDLVSDMIQHVERGQVPLSTAELVHSLGGILLAGHETSTNMIGNGLAFLLSQREHWVALCEHPDRIPAYLEELLRYDTPAQTFFRTATKQTAVGGVAIPAHALILIIFGAAHRDEHHFNEADHFCPNREEKSFVFGYGQHYCVGATLAKLEGRIAFETLTQRLPTLHLEEKQDYGHIETLMFRGFRRLKVAW